MYFVRHQQHHNVYFCYCPGIGQLHAVWISEAIDVMVLGFWPARMLQGFLLAFLGGQGLWLAFLLSWPSCNLTQPPPPPLLYTFRSSHNQAKLTKLCEHVICLRQGRQFRYLCHQPVTCATARRHLLPLGKLPSKTFVALLVYVWLLGLWHPKHVWFLLWILLDLRWSMIKQFSMFWWNFWGYFCLITIYLYFCLITIYH